MIYSEVLVKKLSYIQELILLEKELHYQEHLISYLQTLQMIYEDVNVLYRKYEDELKVEINKKKEIERKLNEIPQYPLKAFQKLNHYMEAYKLSSTNISRITSASSTSIQNYLNKGIIEDDTYHFILWGITQFRLPAEDFLEDITSSMKNTPIKRYDMLMNRT